MSIHAVHAGAERNVCYLLKHPKPPPIHLKRCSPCTNQHIYPYPTPSPHLQDPPTAFSSAFFVQMRYRCKYQVLSTGPNILEVYIIYLHIYVSVGILSHISCATTQISLCIFKVCQNFRCSHTQSMDVDKDNTKF